ncbi:MAG: helix-turn-helix transcriptional regulator [Polyangiaceae bacterium]
MRPAPTRVDSEAVIDLVELAYSNDRGDDLKTALLEKLLGILPGARTAGSYEFRLTNLARGCELEITSPLQVVGSDYHENAWKPAIENTPPVMLEQLLGRTHASTASVDTGLGPMMLERTEWNSMWKEPVRDSLGLTVFDISNNGVLFFIGLTETTTLRARERALLSKVAMHLSATYRLGRAPNRDRLQAAEAVLTPNGKVLHALGAAQDHLEQLDTGRRQRDYARKNRNDAEKALEVWQGLVSGRWSLVDHFDTDGKRFLLAMKNAPRVDRRADLTPRERRVCALAAMGHRDKEIAYMLGLTLGSVTASLSRARSKLHVSSRAELVTAWRSG